MRRACPWLDGACTPAGHPLLISNMTRRLALFLLLLLPSPAFCEEPKKEATPKPADTAAAAGKVTLKTSKGTIVIQLDKEKAPITVENFLGYVKKKHYDGTVFHRVMPDFMIQGGGFAVEGKDLVEKETGKGILNEGKNGLKNLRGTIAMARTPDPDSATAQFFINVKDNPMLDYPSGGGYAVFGKVIEGMDVVDKIKAVPTATLPLLMRHPATGEKIRMPNEDVPQENVVILSATAE